MSKLKMKNSSWIFIVPICNLIITKSVGSEFKVNKVIFLSYDRLCRVRRSWGFPNRISEYNEKCISDNFFNHNRSYAVVRRGGKPEELSNDLTCLVERELAILVSSQLGYCKRKRIGFPKINDGGSSSNNFLFIDSNSEDVFSKLSSNSVGDNLSLDNEWFLYQKINFFLILIDILQKKIKVQGEFRNILSTVTYLIGRSLTTNDCAQAFIYNMIAIETLLTKRGDKYSDVLPMRIGSFFGRFIDDCPEKINSIYEKRCKCVHKGDFSGINMKDLQFSDHLLRNLLFNIVTNHKWFQSRQSIIDHSNKIQAEKLLGIKKTKTYPKIITFFENK